MQSEIANIPMIGELDKFNYRLQCVLAYIMISSIGLMCIKTVLVAIRNFWGGLL